jgi:diguanylate cyclase (GGDEF)-like protein
MEAHRRQLGEALLARADDVARRVLAAIWPSGVAPIAPGTLEELAETDRTGTRLIGRWLTGGDVITEAERQRLGALGGLVDLMSLDDLVKAYLGWRDALLAVLAEEGARLGSPAPLLEEVAAVVARNADGSIVRMARHFERERQRLSGELEAERAKLADLALHDALTGLPNRTLLFDRIDRALRTAARGEASRPTVLFADLDGFKAVNDRFGHETGDELLVAVAARLQDTVRGNDTVARLGGDEFVVLCGGLERSTELVDRISTALRRPFALHGEPAAISASIGIAGAAEGDGPKELLRRADAAMYVAKRQGPGRHHVAA